MVGGVVSRTVTVKDAVDWFPAESTADTVTVVVPSGKTELGAWLYWTGTGPSILSVAVAENAATAPAALLALSTR